MGDGAPVSSGKEKPLGDTLRDMEQSTLDPMDALTPAKREFVREVASGKSARQAAHALGYSLTSGVGSKMMADENVRLALKQAVIAAGLTPESIGTALHAGVNGNRVELDRNGEEHDLGPDWANRAKHLDIAIKMLGGYPNPKLDVDVRNQNVVVIRAEQGLATADPFTVDGEIIEGTEVLPRPETRSESHYSASRYVASDANDKFDSLS